MAEKETIMVTKSMQNSGMGSGNPLNEIMLYLFVLSIFLVLALLAYLLVKSPLLCGSLRAKLQIKLKSTID